MNNLQRYDIYADSNFLGPILDFVEEKDGQWVKFEDAERLVDFLRFAYYNLRLEIPEGDCEYDFCTVCGEPEFKHKEDCNGVAWKRDVEDLLAQQVSWNWNKESLQ